MRKNSLILWGVMLLCFTTALVAIPRFSGRGWVGTATTTPFQLTGLKSNFASIKNSTSSTERIFVLVNATSNDLVTALAATNAIPIDVGDSWTFAADGDDQIKNVVVATTNSTAEYLIGSW